MGISDLDLGIDYQRVNNFIQLSRYPLPLNFEKALWFMSLKMASAFWAIRMTERTKPIAAFVCPFGHFHWIRMPFTLKNTPLIYHQVINKFIPRISDYLTLDPQDGGPLGCGIPGYTGCENNHTPRLLPTLADKMTVFKTNIPAPTQISPVLGCSSYIDDIALNNVGS
ncbi:LOW QUALITY PROTEIN: reverse transcriptase [Phytophthora megakarya]|uniref:Reverse transcriptase n=1 Tax=Phytophthora megakarya TaxID=4795 RepID=A0A225WNM9_9STRA|nr:LOW QUALITY PROTEIN: reverse transcriptase [Phytophthora megakarya]